MPAASPRGRQAAAAQTQPLVPLSSPGCCVSLLCRGRVTPGRWARPEITAKGSPERAENKGVVFGGA